MARPITTLFMLQSLDGKISSGSTDALDADRDWCRIDGVKEGLGQYYAIEQTTDLFTLNTGRVMEKIGANRWTQPPAKTVCSFVILDNKPHLDLRGLEYMTLWAKKLFLVTTNKDHPAYTVGERYDNLEILYYERLDLARLLEDLHEKHGVERLTIQSGGSLNGLFLREDLIDYVHVVVAPLLVGGKDVPTLIDGQAIERVEELHKLRAMELMECNVLENSYVQLKYQVIRGKREE